MGKGIFKQGVLNKTGEATDKQMVHWATEYLRPHLTPCVEHIIRIDEGRKKEHGVYRRMLKRPLYRSSDLSTGMNGQILQPTKHQARGFRSIVKTLVSHTLPSALIGVGL